MNILNIFAHSSFHPIRVHMEKTLESAQLFPIFLECLYAKERKKAMRLYQNMTRLKAQASMLKQHILLQPLAIGLDNCLYRDLFDLVCDQNKVVYLLHAIAQSFLEKHRAFSSSLIENYIGLQFACMNAIEKAKLAQDRFEQLLKEKREGATATRRAISHYLLELEYLLSEAEQIHYEIASGFSSGSDGLSAIDTHYVMKVFEVSQQILGYAQKMGQRLQWISTAPFLVGREGSGDRETRQAV